jgi:flagellar FliL protein
MSDEQLEDEEKAKSPVLKIILIVVGILLLIGITVGGTLFASGFFDAGKDVNAEEAIAALEAEAAVQAAAAAGPDKVKQDSPELTRFEQSYFQLPKPLVANVANSRKVMQGTVAIMTHYDERVVANVEKHDFPLRFAMLAVMRRVTESEISGPDFQTNLAASLKMEMNAVLESLEDFGGIEAVYFTEFVVQ